MWLRAPAAWRRAPAHPGAVPAWLWRTPARMRVIAAWLLATPAWLLAAPVSGQARGPDTVVVTEDPLWDRVRVVEELRFGDLEGPEATTFGRISALVVEEDGDIVVYDAHVPALRRFTGDGRFVQTIGRAGEAPGEYRRVDGLVVLPGSEFAIWDLGLQRITVYDSAGRSVRTYRFCCGVGGAEIFHADSAGNFYIKTALIRRTGDRPTRQWPRAFVRVDDAGVPKDTLPLPLEEAPDLPLIVPLPEGPRVPFVEEWRHAMSNRGYLVQGRNSRYRVEIVVPGGRRRVLRRDVEPVEIGPGERSQWESWTAFVDQLERARGFTHTFTPIPDSKPFFRSLFVDADGRIWIDRYVPARHEAWQPFPTTPDAPSFSWREPPTFDVIRPDGRLLGTLELRPDVRLLFSRGDSIWGVARGEFDEEYVVRLRIEERNES